MEGSTKTLSLPAIEAYLLSPAPMLIVLSVCWVAVGTSAKAGPSKVPLRPRILLPIGDALMPMFA
jgi:hypothetical protein